MGEPAGGAAPRSRAEDAADVIAERVRASAPGARLGSRDELRAELGVSVGTLHEALRLLQSTGEIRVRTGPGGGIFAGQSSRLGALLRSGAGTSGDAESFREAMEVMQALSPLLMAGVADSLDDAAAEELRARVRELAATRDAPPQDVVRASLEVFTTIVAFSPNAVLRAVLAAVLRARIDDLPKAALLVPDVGWRADVDRHVQTVSAIAEALIAGDADAVARARVAPELLRPFSRVAQAWTSEVDGIG